MPILQSDIKSRSTGVLGDGVEKLFLQNAKLQYDNRHKKTADYFSDLELAKRRATLTRWKAIENLDKFLIEFEANCIKAGIKVLWALNAEQAHEELAAVVNRHEIKNVFASKGFLTDEIMLDDFAANNNLPLPINLAKGNTANVKSFLRSNISDSSNQFPPQNLDSHENLVLIQQANFIVADTGSVVISDYESNADENFCAPKVSVVLCGIDQLLPSINDLELFLALQGVYASENGMQSVNKIISAPTGNGSSTGEVYVLLVDNGRSNLLESELHRQSLYCIQCGACQASCPVMQSVGSANCDNVYSGPIGFAGLPYWKGQKEFSHLAYASPLCGKCNDVCPVKIDFKKSMLALRHETVKRKQNTQQEKLFYYIWKKTMLKRELIGWRKINTYKYAVDTVFLKSKSGLRSLPASASKSFNQQWRDRNGLK